MSRARVIALVVVALSALLAPGAASAAAPAEQLYVSVGGSYASGYQPGVVPSEDGNTRNGFAYQVPALAASRGYRLRLVNFGCGGATTTSLISTEGCPPRALGPGGRAYPGRTQLAAAERFLRSNRRAPRSSRCRSGATTSPRAPRSRGVRRVGRGGDREERQRDREASAPGRRAPRPDRRHHLSRRDPRTVGERRPGIPRPGLAGVRLPDAHQPRSEEGLRHGGDSLRRRDRGVGRVHALGAGHDAPALRHGAGGRGACVRAQLLLRAGRHPRPDRRLCSDSSARGGSAAATKPPRPPPFTKACLQVGRRSPALCWPQSIYGESGR